MLNRSLLALTSVVHLLRPAIAFLIRNGVAYPAFAAAAKELFLQQARAELERDSRQPSLSALTILSGVHRCDVRKLTATPDSQDRHAQQDLNLASQVVSRWLSDPRYLARDGSPAALARSVPVVAAGLKKTRRASFDELASSLSTDVRPRAVLNELERLGMVAVEGDRVRLLEPGFVPRQGFAEMATLMSENVRDHVAAATLNLEGGHNFLEQAVFVEELSAASAHRLHVCAARAWQAAFQTVMREAHTLHAHDKRHTPPAQRTHRARFGTYFFESNDHEVSDQAV
ncbi:MAG TPA: DUF6502 family protein [Ottowia sp.]|nr:DUF6502 family protein [Ottowia sp.]